MQVFSYLDIFLIKILKIFSFYFPQMIKKYQRAENVMSAYVHYDLLCEHMNKDCPL